MSTQWETTKILIQNLHDKISIDSQQFIPGVPDNPPDGLVGCPESLESVPLVARHTLLGHALLLPLQLVIEKLTF